MDKDDLPTHDEHNDNPTAKVPLHEPSEDALKRSPAVEQMPGAEPPLDRAPSLGIQPEDLMGGAPSEDLAPIRTGEQAEVVMKAREAHIEEATPVVVEAAQASSQDPWWKRIFARWSREEEAAEILSEAGPEEALKEGLPSEGALPAVPADHLPLEAAQEMAPTTEEDLEAAAPVPWWRWLLTWLTWDEGPDGVAPDEEAAPLTADEARALVGEELACLREDTAGMVHHELERAQEKMAHSVEEQVPGLVQAELAREQGNHYRAAERALREVGDEMAAANLQLLQAEQDLLNQEVLPALQDPDLSLRERLELMDLVGDHPSQVAGYMAELERAAARRVAEADQALAESDARGSVAELQAEVARQSEVVAKLEAQGRRGVLGPWGLVPALLVLLLVAAVGVAGILFPRETGRDPSFLVEMAALYQAAGKNEEALHLLEEATAAGIHDTETLARAGQTYHELREFPKAVEALEQAVEQAPQNPEIRLSLARSLTKSGRQQEAVVQYERLLASDGNGWRYHLELGQLYEAQQDHDQAIAEYQQVAELTPRSVAGPVQLGNLYRTLERYDEALEQYRRVLELSPDSYSGYVFSGASYAGMRDFDRAIEQYQAAMRIEPENPNAYFYLGEAYLAQGLFEAALSPYQQALVLNPNWASARLGLGKAYLNLGDCENASAEFLEVLQQQPDSEEAQEGIAACEGESGGGRANPWAP